jgi:coenzyme F420-0:L-glutamate ligase/coenzyme F420-1:gamma-L-glutamate ligase
VSKKLTIEALPGISRVNKGADLVALIGDAMDRCDRRAADGDVFVIAQKIVSKAEGRVVKLADVNPSEKAKTLARKTDKDPRLVELILGEADEVVRYRKDVLVVAHRLGIVHANAGIDRSNVDSEDVVLLLPEAPDASAREIRKGLEARYGVRLGVVISDSTGRAWRIGTVGLAIGASGVETVQDLVGRPDLFGRPLEATVIGHGDELAAAASIIMGQADEGIPVVLISGLRASTTNQTAADLLRSKTEDLFR